MLKPKITSQQRDTFGTAQARNLYLGNFCRRQYNKTEC